MAPENSWAASPASEAAPAANPCCNHRLPKLMAGEGGSEGLLTPSDLFTAPERDFEVLDETFLIDFLFHLISPS